MTLNETAATPKRRRGVIYVRQSNGREESISLELQEQACREYADRHAIDVVAVIQEVHTGRVWHKRRGVQRALNMIERGEADVILLWKWSRLSRKRLHWAAAEDRVERLGGTIEAATEQVDVSTAAGRLSRNVLVDLAEFQSDSIGEVWRETHEYRRRRGLPASGGRRFGYIWRREPGQPERYEPDPETAPILRWMYEQYIAGTSPETLARELNRRGIRNARGGLWWPKNLRDVLDSGFAAGLLARIPVDKDGRRVYERFPKRRWDRGAHEPIITQETWEQYRRARMARAALPPRTRHPAHPLSGLLRCGECGGSLHRHYQKRNCSGKEVIYYRYVCYRAVSTGIGRAVTISERRVTAAVLDWLADLADELDTAADAVRVESPATRARDAIAAAEREIAEIDRQLARLTRQLVAGVVPEEAYQPTRDELLADRAAALDRLNEARGIVELPDIEPVPIARGLLSEWDTLPVAHRRELLARLIRVVLVYPPARPRGLSPVRIVPVWEPEPALSGDQGAPETA